MDSQLGLFNKIGGESFSNFQGPIELKIKENVCKHRHKAITKLESNLTKNKSLKFKFGYAKNVELALKKRYTLNINIPSYLTKHKDNQRFEEYINHEFNTDNCNMAKHNCNGENYIQHQLFEYPDEYLYKEFPASSCHMKGLSEQISVVLSSHAFYMIYPYEAKLKFKIPYEDIEIIIIGSYARWLAIRRKIVLNDLDVLEKSPYTYFEMTEPRMVMDFIKYFEVAIRRRLQTLYLNERFKDDYFDTNIDHYFTTLRRRVDNPSLSLSIGQLIDHISPSVISSFSQEIEYIEKCLAKQDTDALKIAKVVKCCLVFWENGSMAISDEDESYDIGPHLEGHLMIHLHSLKTWVPAYFILKRGVLYQFTESTDPLPNSIIELSDCCGCSRITSELRPYGFQVIRESDSPILLAAPNEQIASRWLQVILKFLCFKEETEKRKFLPCQLIQTTSGLALTHQGDICNILMPCKKSSEKSANSLDRPKIGRHLDKPLKQEKLKSFRSDKCPKYVDITSSSENVFNTSSCDEVILSCPPTPPPLHIPAAKSLSQENMSILKILSCASYYQISEILVDLKAKAAFVEFECSEASELALDWALYFTSENHLNNFISNIRAMSKSDGEISITDTSSGQISKFLRGGALDIYRRNHVKLLFS